MSKNILYTFDSMNQLSEQMTINPLPSHYEEGHFFYNHSNCQDFLLELCPTGFSQHGFFYLMNYFPSGSPITNSQNNEPVAEIMNTNDISNYVSQIVEMVFELVRQLEFPEKPSRFVSIFCCKSLNDIDQFISNYRKGIDSYVYEVFVDENYHTADMANLSRGRTIIDTLLNARLYWAGKQNILDREPFWECVVPLPSTLGLRVKRGIAES